MKKDRGSMSYVVFTVVFFLSALSISLFLLLTLSLNLEKRQVGKTTVDDECANLLSEIIEDYLNDDTPEAVSTFDDFFAEYSDYTNEILHCEIKDLSSAINLNYVDPGIILESDLQLTLSSTINTEGFIETRKEIGMTIDINDYNDLFLGDEWQDNYTLWGTANANIIEEEALKSLLKARLGQETLSYQIINGREQDFLTPEEYAEACGSSYDELKAVMNTLPPVNVNFVEEEILDTVFQSLFGQENQSQYPWQNKRDSILSRRMSAEITPEELEGILAVTNNTKIIAQYLGTWTSYWKITFTPEEGPVREVILYTPKSENRKMQIISRRTLYDND